MTLKVQLYRDYSYSVIDDDDEEFNVRFVGSLADCEAYIRLTEQGRM